MRRLLRSGAMSRSTCLARMSTSRLTRAPGAGAPEVVRSSVSGISETAKPSSRERADREADAVDGDRALLDDVARELGLGVDLDDAREASLVDARRPSPVPSTCPCTMCPPSRSPARSAQLEVHRRAGAERAERGARSVSFIASARKPSPPAVDRRQADAVDRDRVAFAQLARQAACGLRASRPRRRARRPRCCRGRRSGR